MESPVTEYVFKYLKDSADDEAEILREGILGGSIFTEAEQIRISVIYATLISISEIELEEIENFYEEKELNRWNALEIG